MSTVSLSVEEARRLMKAIEGVGSLDALLARAQAPARRGQSRIEFRTAAEVLSARADRVITREEARRLLRIPGPSRRRSTP
ncbi:MAG: hypothetical protein ACRDZY_08040 [Acidimicrobiales bacterium]